MTRRYWPGAIMLWFMASTAFGGEKLNPTLPLAAIYEHLHQNPELSLQEQNTSAYIAAELQNAGFEVSRNFGGYGVVAVLKNGAGPTILIRSDSDALPVGEETGLPYASKVQAKDSSGKMVGVMHACGHDVHMTVLVGTAREMVQKRNLWSGTLLMIMQPAEERGVGATAMLKAGLFTKFPRPSYNLALHVAADEPAGSVSYTTGYATSNVDSVDIQVYGIGGHGAQPEKTKDPIVLAAQLVLALQTIVSRELSPLERAVVTVGAIHGGSQHNVIGNQVDLQLTVRSFSPKARQQILAAIKRISRGLGLAAGLPEDKLPVVLVKEDFVPSVYNDPQLTSRAAKVFAQTLGEKNVKETAPSMVGEDFAFYGHEEPRIPSLLYWLGSIDPALFPVKKSLPSLHSAQYQPQPGATIATGVKSMTALAIDLFH